MVPVVGGGTCLSKNVKEVGLIFILWYLPNITNAPKCQVSGAPPILLSFGIFLYYLKFAEWKGTLRKQAVRPKNRITSAIRPTLRYFLRLPSGHCTLKCSARNTALHILLHCKLHNTAFHTMRCTVRFNCNACCSVEREREREDSDGETFLVPFVLILTHRCHVELDDVIA